jgi:hypothetical protein
VITRPFVAIDMDAQPGIRESLFQEIDKVSGFAARFLIHEPTSMFGLRHYVDPPCEPDRALIAHLGFMYAKLWESRLGFDANGLVDPQPIYLNGEAERLWAQELEHLERRLPTAAPDEEGFFGHLRGRLLRLAGVLALWENPNAGFVDGVAMRRAILIGRYFLRHHRAAARAAREADLIRAVESIREWAANRLQAGKEVSVREAARQWRRYRGPQGAAVAVAHFREAGLAPEKPAKSEGPGRPKGSRWVFPNGPTKPAKSPGRGEEVNNAGFAGIGVRICENAPPDWDARFAALNQSLALELDLPPGGKGTCPFCGHDGCFGQVKDTCFWKCFGDRHAADAGGVPDHGDLLDLWFHRVHGRLPSKEERVQQLLAFENGGES